MTVLHAEHVTAGYGARVALRDCELRLDAGEMVAIVGPNGAGKSTLMRVLAGLLRPSSGRVLIDGTDLARLDRARTARRIAVVPQVFDTLFPFSVREIVGLGRTARLGLMGRATVADAAAVDRALRELDLIPLADRSIDALSGGERQRAVLAMALAQEGDVLLLDEPTVHLDPAHQIATLDLVSRLAQDRGLIVAAVLHDLNLAAALASRIVVVAEGRIVRDGTPLRIFNDDLIRSVFGVRLVVVPGDPPMVLPRVTGRTA
jgi:iron complex transport system ATP-binding protein